MPDHPETDSSSRFAEVVGVLVSPREMPRRSRPARKADPDVPATTLPGFGRVGYLAVSDTELAIFRTTTMSVHPGPKGAPLTRVPRRELTAVELDERRLVAFLRLTFADGASWPLQVGYINRPAARQLVAELQPA